MQNYDFVLIGTTRIEWGRVTFDVSNQGGTGVVWFAGQFKDKPRIQLTPISSVPKNVTCSVDPASIDGSGFVATAYRTETTAVNTGFDFIAIGTDYFA